MILERILQASVERRAAGAAAFAARDQDLCMLCGAHGPDKRSLFIDCGYAVYEVVPEVLDVQDLELKRGRGYYLLICKSCRASLLTKMQEWRDERVSLRDLPKDHDGELLELGDAERNIPVRVHGAIQMMTHDEWMTWRARGRP